MGTIQSLNKIGSEFTRDDLDVLGVAAHMIAVAMNNARKYEEALVTNKARRRLIYTMIDQMDSHCVKA